MKTIMTVEDIRAELRQASARARELPHQQRYNRHPAIVLRDELIRTALSIGLRPALIKADTGLARSRIYQIRDADDEHVDKLLAAFDEAEERGTTQKPEERDPAGHRMPCVRIECQVGDGA